MTRNFINQLPVGILTMFFDMMTIKEQLESMTTCMLWASILSDDRYLQQRRFALCKDNADGVGLSVERIQRYRAFRISDLSASSEETKEYLQTVRAFLSREEVMSSVEDLHLEIKPTVQLELFKDTQHWFFPNLERVIAQNMSNDSIAINAPKLTQLKLVGPDDGPSDLVETLCDRIEELNLFGLNCEIIYKTVWDKTFANLQSLTLNIRYSETVHASFNVHRLCILPQLKYLEIRDDFATFRTVYKDMFLAAVNLETLIVIGVSMCADAYNAIQNLNQLRELSLLVYINGYSTVEELSLPKLEKLTLTHCSVVLLGNVPKLKCVCIEQYSPKIRIPAVTALHDILFNIADQIEIFQLNKVIVTVKIFKKICMFKNLKFLEMKAAFVEMEDLAVILCEVPMLQGIAVIGSHIMRHSENFSKRDVNLSKQEELSFFEWLKEQHPSTTIEHIIDETRHRGRMQGSD